MIFIIFLSFILLFLWQSSLFVTNSTFQSEVKQFIQNTKTRKSNPVAPLPLFKTVEGFQYEAQNLRNPFEIFVNSIAKKPLPEPLGKGVDDRPRELLESYSLDTLHMVGTISNTDAMYALVRDRQGIVHRVGVGNYMGQNFGKIQKITESTIEIQEWGITNQDIYEAYNVTLHLFGD